MSNWRGCPASGSRRYLTYWLPFQQGSTRGSTVVGLRVRTIVSAHCNGLRDFAGDYITAVKPHMKRALKSDAICNESD